MFLKRSDYGTISSFIAFKPSEEDASLETRKRTYPNKTQNAGLIISAGLNEKILTVDFEFRYGKYFKFSVNLCVQIDVNL